MTGPAAPSLHITDELVRTIGEGYLFNVVRPAGLVCEVCSTCVTPGWTMCRTCERHVGAAMTQGIRLADQVVPVVYGAAPDHQSGRLMRTYKGDRATARQRARVTLLGLLTFQQHRRCMEGPTVARLPISAWASVPSTSGRQGEHPMHALGRSMSTIGAGHCVGLTAGPGASGAGQRALVGDRWVASNPADAAGRHVLLVDDTWTTGAKAQSAAAALHAAGAQAVTVLVLARWMDLTFGNTLPFLREHGTVLYTPALCPITGAGCPPP